MKIVLTVLSLFLSSALVAEIVQSQKQNIEILPEAYLVDVSEFPEVEFVAVLGEKGVLLEGSDISSASIAGAADRKRLVIRDVRTGKYGTTDGSVIVSLANFADLERLVADYGLTIVHRFELLSRVVVRPDSIFIAGAVSRTLLGDARVLDAELNVDLYDVGPL
jgi:hypothetical protein